MNLVCLDLEGVLVPEIWVEFGKITGIDGFEKTTRDEPDYDVLMNYRIDLLNENGLKLSDIQKVIDEIDPFPGAKEFLDALRDKAQVVIISDTFEQFAGPLMKKLGRPTIFCNELVIADDGSVEGYEMRCEGSKLTTVGCLHECGIQTIASGDSYNDVGMIQDSKAGFFFRTTDEIKEQYPDVPAYETYDELFEAISEALAE